MFRKGIPTLSLFHSPQSEASAAVLKQLRAAGAGDKFTLDVAEGEPTPQQLQTIAENIKRAGSSDISSALSTFVENTTSPVDFKTLASALGNKEARLTRPILVCTTLLLFLFNAGRLE
jgi:hypothetical protein